MASTRIGTKYPLEVRLGATLTPQLITLALGSGAILEPADVDLRAYLYARETDTTPLSAPTFAVTELEWSEAGEPRYLLELSKEDVEALVALPPAAGVKSTPGTRVYWWTCFFEDAAGARRPVYYGRLTIFLGAASG